MENNYLLIDKLLHRLVLNNNFIKSFLYDLEKKLFINKNEEINHNHVFITGLARSGTTILLNLLHSSDTFGSLTYSDMPLILSPNLWKFITRKKRRVETFDRLHGDGIKININSPEAFEEIFWKFLLKESYVKKKHLVFHDLQLKHIQEFKSYIKLILKSKNKNKYLSKNNNNILRLKYLTKYFESSTFVLMFRDPLNHANSLLKMHKKFMDFQKKNQFIEKYMTMLGHYEFGPNYKFFKIVESTNDDFSFDGYKLESWLQLWFDYYKYVIQNCNSKNIKFISYENFSLNSQKYFDELVPEKKNFRNLNFDVITNRNTKFSNSDKYLIKKVYNLYDELKTLDAN
jgi:hypothetical protein